MEESEGKEESEQERYAFDTVTYKLDKVTKESDFKESNDEYKTNVKVKINDNKLHLQIKCKYQNGTYMN